MKRGIRSLLDKPRVSRLLNLNRSLHNAIRKLLRQSIVSVANEHCVTDLAKTRPMPNALVERRVCLLPVLDT
jgi:hypothetical protein